MRLTLVISSLGPGGAERVLSTLANEWSRRNHNVTLVTDAPASMDHYRLDARVSRVSLDALSDCSTVYDKVTRNLVRLRRLRSALVDSAPDVVIAFGSTLNVRAVLARIGLGIPILISERADPREYSLPWPWRLLRRVSYPMADLLVVQTGSVGEWARRWMSKNAIRVVPNPAVPPATPTPRPTALGSRPTVMAVGRLTSQKGFDMLLQSFASSGLASLGWQLAILGQGQERTALAAQAKALGLGDHVLMPGVVEEPRQWMLHSDIFVLSSRFEGFPNALLEAMSCGLPVVSFDCPTGPAEIVRHGETGLLIAPSDTKELASGLARLAYDGELRRRLGAAAASDVAARFSLQRISSMWEEILTQLSARA